MIVYHVDPPAHWPQVAHNRARSHFAVVKLEETYASNANDELMTLRTHLNKIAASKGQAGVAAFLADEQVRYSGRVNSWQHGMYRALAQHGPFIAGGYVAIPQ